MKTSLLTLCILTATSFALGRQGDDKKVPPVLEPPESPNLVTTTGDKLVIHCPVSGAIADVEWYHAPFGSSEPETKLDQMSYTIRRKRLILEGVMKEDQGIYRCKAINGFGNAQYRIYVIVKSSPSETISFDTSRPLSAPLLKESRRRGEVTARPGAAVKLDCDAAANPLPSITWYKDERIIPGETRSVWTLTMGRGDDGFYKCIVHNQLGKTQYVTKVTVSEMYSLEPDFVLGYPLDVAVAPGETATLQCRVRSATRPRLSWLREIKPEERDQYAAVIEEPAGAPVAVIWTEVSGSAGEGWRSDYVIRTARAADAGEYICRAEADDANVVEKRARLTIVPEEPLDTLPLLIAVPAALVICLVGVTAFCCRRKANAARQMKRRPGTSLVQQQPVAHMTPSLTKQHTQRSASPYGSHPSRSSYERPFEQAYPPEIPGTPSSYHHQYPLHSQHPPHNGHAKVPLYSAGGSSSNGSQQLYPAGAGGQYPGVLGQYPQQFPGQHPAQQPGQVPSQHPVQYPAYGYAPVYTFQ